MQDQLNIFVDEMVNIPGLCFRPVQSPVDYARIAALRAETNRHDGIESTDDPAQIQHFFETMEGFNLQRDLILAEVNGEMVGYARVREYEETQTGKRIFSMYGMVHPAQRGQGLGRALVRRVEQIARTVLAQNPGEQPAYLDAFVNSYSANAQDLFQQEGFTLERIFYRMIRPDLENIPDLPLPPGIETRPVLPEHYRIIWDAAMDAFREHWGFHDEGEEAYQGYLASDEFQPELWQIAWEGDQVVGIVRSFVDRKLNERYHFRRGWTEDICVRKAWRDKGIAKALIARSLQTLKDHGMDHAALGVDAENASGALRIYESMGYRVDGSQDIALRKAL
ncbi:MAG TPA: GNAT family N-acetyltransferase [Anaerolineaceae bacterium]